MEELLRRKGLEALVALSVGEAGNEENSEAAAFGAAWRRWPVGCAAV
jgi:hypothetical protein